MSEQKFWYRADPYSPERLQELGYQIDWVGFPQQINLDIMRQIAERLAVLEQASNPREEDEPRYEAEECN